MDSENIVKAMFVVAINLLYKRAGKQCKLGNKSFLDDNFQNLIDEAENILGINKHKNSQGYEPLTSIFDSFASDGKFANQSLQYSLQALNEGAGFIYPNTEHTRCSKNDYEKIVQKFEKEWTAEKILAAHTNAILHALEQFTCMVPADDTVGEKHDVSLYMYSKMLGAVACCIQQCGISQNDKQFLMVSGDISGIQDFIYTIPSKGALKSLRGRSFYLEIFMENFIDELLDELQLTRANLLYAGGGHFYILAANTEESADKINKIKIACNKWLLKHFGTKLYFAVGYLECGKIELQQSDAQTSLFGKISDVLNYEKLHRYDKEELMNLFNHESEYNCCHDGERECIVCHSSSTELMKFEKLSGDGFVCPVCKELYKLGENIIDEEKDVFILTTSNKGDALPMFGVNQEYFIYAGKEEDFCKDGRDVRIYTKNVLTDTSLPSKNLWLVDYSTRNEKGVVKSFEKLSESSVGVEKGIKRLGVLRADVDNLGAAFLAGFANSKDSGLTRYADLSNALAVFFKKAVDDICEGKMPNNFKRFFLFDQEVERKEQRDIHVVYSGGDDMFFVGAWEDLLELAVDIRRCFEKFTNSKMTFSAGLGMFHHSYPVSKMAEDTGELESASKHLLDEHEKSIKNGIALFGFNTEISDKKTKDSKEKEYEYRCDHIYQWDEFIDGVCVGKGGKPGKLKYLLDNLSIKDTLLERKNKILVGKGQLYNLMELLEEDKNKDKMNLARMAYWLGRLQSNVRDDNLIKQYDDFTKQMYEWFCADKDKHQLRTAITLLVYYLRDTEKEG
ncbi:MAG: type III-A CRISPR-associated protein Cas10/Csm1 [Phascolarctobacterium sp.]|nr:type III-A CRISPR-associated protein Cas10/Csm1 [Candidatus Phascolarctobacterium caballi]